MAKSCKKGYYYCYTSKKCKKIPKGYHVMPTGMLMRDSEHKDEETNGKKKNGNGANGDGNGNGDSSGALMAEEYRKRGVRSIKGQSIVTVQKGSLKEHIAREERK